MVHVRFEGRSFDLTRRELGLNGQRRDADVKTRQEYLFDPKRSIWLGAAWFKQKKLPDTGDNLVLAIMAHHAGSAKVQEWQRDWNLMGHGDDIEFMVETARSRGTRNFVRRVLADYAIVCAAGMFDPACPTRNESRRSSGG